MQGSIHTVDDYYANTKITVLPLPAHRIVVYPSLGKHTPCVRTKSVESVTLSTSLGVKYCSRA